MCHESSGTALTEAIGIGKGTVTLDDFDHADAIFVIGQNPGTNHPRMLTTLLEAKRRGVPHREHQPAARARAWCASRIPQDPLACSATAADLGPVPAGARSAATWRCSRACRRSVLEAEARAPARVLDRDFIARAHGRLRGPARRPRRRRTGGALVARAASPARRSREPRQRSTARRAERDRLLGHGAHPAPARGGQRAGDREPAAAARATSAARARASARCADTATCRATARWASGERPSADFLDRARRRVRLRAAAPARPRHAWRRSGPCTRARDACSSRWAATSRWPRPDTAFTAAALRRCRLTVQISTTLNRSHLVTGEEALILPCLGRTERDVQAGGPQFVTVENSMSVVHASRRAARAGLAGAAQRARHRGRASPGRCWAPASRVPWEELVADYDRIRERIARVIPGFEDMNRARAPAGGLRAARAAPATRRFDTPSGRAHFTRAPGAADPAPGPGPAAADDHPQPRPVQHDGLLPTTTATAASRGDRRVVLPASADDMEAAGPRAEGSAVDLTSHFEGETRSAAKASASCPSTCRRAAPAPTTPRPTPWCRSQSFAERSRTPAYKSVVISLAPSAEAGPPAGGPA